MYHNNAYDIIWFDKLSSTNETIKQDSKTKNLVNRTVYSTHYQHSGKGQMGNEWESESNKNLTFSIYLKPEPILIQDQFMISKAVSIGIINVFSEISNNFCIKWPNDIYYNNYKIGGILIENSLMNNSINESIIGIGLNINQEDFLSDAPNPISLIQITNSEHNKALLLENILASIFNELDKLSNPLNYNNVSEKYISYLFRNTGMHAFKDSEGVFNGSFEGISEYGQLQLMKENGLVQTYSFKEVEFILDNVLD